MRRGFAVINLPPEPLVCATYERVSTNHQPERGYSLAAQAESLEAYAAQQGWLLPDDLRFRDTDSGALWDLPGLQAMLEAARQCRFRVLLVWDLDRFARSLTKALVLEEQLKKYGVRVHYLRVPVEDTPEGRLLKHQLFSIAEYEREKIRLRASLGLRQKVLSGKVALPGRCAYGYAWIDGTSAIDPAEAAIIERIFRLIGVERRSARSVAQMLTQEGIPTPSQRRGTPAQHAANGVWHVSTIFGIVRNPLYKGQWAYGRRKSLLTDRETTTTRWQPPELWLQAPAPAIVSPERWRLVNEALDAGKARSPRRSKEPYLLRGLVTCSCGRILIGTSKAGPTGARYYRCPARGGRLLRAVHGPTLPRQLA